MPGIACNPAFVMGAFVTDKNWAHYDFSGVVLCSQELLVSGLNQPLEYMVYIISLYVHWMFLSTFL